MFLLKYVIKKKSNIHECSCQFRPEYLNVKSSKFDSPCSSITFKLCVNDTISEYYFKPCPWYLKMPLQLCFVCFTSIRFIPFSHHHLQSLSMIIPSLPMSILSLPLNSFIYIRQQSLLLFFFQHKRPPYSFKLNRRYFPFNLICRQLSLTKFATIFPSS